MTTTDNTAATADNGTGTHHSRTEALADSRIHPELHALIETALAQGHEVYYYVSRFEPATSIKKTTWAIVHNPETGNVATVSHDTFTGLDVSYPVTPSREYGSALVVWAERDGSDNELPGFARGMGTAEDALRVALNAPTFVNFANPGHPLKNHGMKHYAWTRGDLIKIGA